ncbi:50S ribosomal protein L32 [Candidatus Dojkabacteria bacterium]|nr:50S ribosomal protein L32 [Candidatus Dojkabacteria bacterium]
MGALPKRKISKQRKNKRRAHHALKQIPLVRETESGKLKRPHYISPKTGRYKGEEIKEV